MWQKEKFLVLSNFFFCHYVFKKPSAAETSKSVLEHAFKSCPFPHVDAFWQIKTKIWKNFLNTTLMIEDSWRHYDKRRIAHNWLITTFATIVSKLACSRLVKLQLNMGSRFNCYFLKIGFYVNVSCFFYRIGSSCYFIP